MNKNWETSEKLYEIKPQNQTDHIRSVPDQTDIAGTLTAMFFRLVRELTLRKAKSANLSSTSSEQFMQKDCMSLLLLRLSTYDSFGNITRYTYCHK